MISSMKLRIRVKPNSSNESTKTLDFFYNDKCRDKNDEKESLRLTAKKCYDYNTLLLKSSLQNDTTLAIRQFF